MRDMPEVMRGPIPDRAAVAVRAWNLMGGEIKWEALETIAAMLGVRDVEMLIKQLVIIREALSED